MTESMEEQNKREQPFAFYFFLLSILIIVLFFWVFWFETVQLRPWKSYQKQYWQMKREQLEDNYNRIAEEFQNDSTQQLRQELVSQLEIVTNKFNHPKVQEEYIAIQKELEKIQERLNINKMEFRDARGAFLELEYLVNKNQNESDKIRLEELQLEIEKLSNENQTLLTSEQSLKEKIAVFTEESERIATAINALEISLMSARETKDRIDDIPIEIKQVYFADINKADRCQSCHIGIDNPDKISELQPLTQHTAKYIFLDNHPPSEFGCTFCHQGQGRATSSVTKAHGQIEHWLEPMLFREMTQATCQSCHGDIQHLPGGELIAKGMEIVEKYGCYGCHQIAGYNKLRKVGPDLTEVGTKVNFSWLVKWIMNPKNYLPAARMPKFYLSQKEAEAIGDYLFSMTRKSRLDESQEDINWELADKGKVVWRNSRCNICHATNGVGGIHEKIYAPDLGKVGSKVSRDWLFNWIKDPKIYFPKTKMSRFRFDDDDIWALVEYIRSEFVDWDFEPQYTEPVTIKVESIQRGKELIQKYGCFGCHNVKGMEQMKRIGPFLRNEEVSYLKTSEIDEKIGSELSSIGSKPLEQLDFGKMAKQIQHNRISYIKQKLKDPRSYRDNLKMPNFSLNDEEINGLVVLLTGFTDADIPTRFKRPKQPVSYEPTGDFGKIVDDVKCLNCHSIFGNGAEFAPDLSIEGSKVQESWLRSFLKQPDVIRPMLKQMPLFNLEHKQRMIQGNLTYLDIETIVQYFKQVLITPVIPLNLPENGLSLDKQVEAGEKFYDKIGCKTCHQIGTVGGSVGPSLTDVGNRLTPGYIFKHLENPQVFNTNIVEPNYNFSESERVNLTRYLGTLKE